MRLLHFVASYRPHTGERDKRDKHHAAEEAALAAPSSAGSVDSSSAAAVADFFIRETVRAAERAAPQPQEAPPTVPSVLQRLCTVAAAGVGADDARAFLMTTDGNDVPVLLRAPVAESDPLASAVDVQPAVVQRQLPDVEFFRSMLHALQDHQHGDASRDLAWPARPTIRQALCAARLNTKQARAFTYAVAALVRTVAQRDLLNLGAADTAAKREAEAILAYAERLLLKGQQAVIYLGGPGGTGKSHLIMAICWAELWELAPFVHRCATTGHCSGQHPGLHNPRKDRPPLALQR